MWDLIVSVPDHCLSFNFGNKSAAFVYTSLRPFSYTEIVQS